MDAEALKELCEPLGPVTVRRLFSGYGVYRDGLCFAIHIRGETYFKGGAGDEAFYQAAGSQRFTYAMAGKPKSMNYWRLPASVFDDADEIRIWGRRAIEAAQEAALAKSAKPKRRAPAPRSQAKI